MLSVFLFAMIKLPFGMGDLEPVISQNTLNFHYGVHLKTYVDNLNKLVVGTPFETKSLKDIVREADGAIFNNAGQILNHNLYFTQFAKPHENNQPMGKLKTAIEKEFGSFDAFKQVFMEKGNTLFGSGWVWLSADKNGKLYITQETNANNPIRNGLTPLLTMDVWEHAYYLDYQNKRAGHLNALWSIINWQEIDRRYAGR